MSLSHALARGMRETSGSRRSLDGSDSTRRPLVISRLALVRVPKGPGHPCEGW